MQLQNKKSPNSLLKQSLLCSFFMHIIMLIISIISYVTILQVWLRVVCHRCRNSPVLTAYCVPQVPQFSSAHCVSCAKGAAILQCWLLVVCHRCRNSWPARLSCRSTSRTLWWGRNQSTSPWRRSPTSQSRPPGRGSRTRPSALKDTATLTTRAITDPLTIMSPADSEMSEDSKMWELNN